MAFPFSIRNWLIQLRTFNRPIVWCTGAGLVLIAIALRQYWQHPEWMGRFDLDENSTGQAELQADLTPEERRSLAEIDNLDVLLQDMQSLSNSPPSASLAPTSLDESASLLTLLEQVNTGPASQNRQPSTSVSPFAPYLEAIQFRGAANEPSTSPPRSSPFLSSPFNQTPSAGLNRMSPLTSQSEALQAQNLPRENTSTEQPFFVSPLQQILQQQSAPAVSETSPDAQTRSIEERSTTSSTPSAASTPAPPLTPGVLNQQAPWLVEAPVPGIQQSFIRTTPEMSPPPGTTGYRVPDMFAPPVSGANGSIAPAGGAGVSIINPDLSPPSSARLDLTSPTAPVNTPNTPSSGTLYVAPNLEAVEPAPFSVPRPPGSHTGGGYIYTFSDPNGPVD